LSQSSALGVAPETSINAPDEVLGHVMNLWVALFPSVVELSHMSQIPSKSISPADAGPPVPSGSAEIVSGPAPSGSAFAQIAEFVVRPLPKYYVGWL
jgi:hypothetical protein